MDTRKMSGDEFCLYKLCMHIDYFIEIYNTLAKIKVNEGNMFLIFISGSYEKF